MLTVCFLFKTSLRSNNKDCTEAVCLYSSRKVLESILAPTGREAPPALQSSTPFALNRSSGSKAHP